MPKGFYIVSLQTVSQNARRKLGFVENRDDGNQFIKLIVEYGVVLNAEASKNTLQMIDWEPGLGEPWQVFEAFPPQTLHVECGLMRTERAAGRGSGL